jgi:branched-chain amino acid transport system ATP-binding protein
MAFFEVRNITKRFGGLSAVNDVSFTLERGELLGLIGPNGSGKTTTLNIITNAISPDKGQILINETDITNVKTHKVVKMGISRTFQISTLFMNMTVLQNVELGFHTQRESLYTTFLRGLREGRGGDERYQAKAMGLLDFVGVKDLKNELAKNLPHGHQRCVALAVALATNPQLILLDEPISGMTESEQSFIMQRVVSLKKEGISILLIEHNMKVVMNYCERIIVLNFGKKIAEGSPYDIQTNKQVVKAYLGESYAITDE